MAKTEGSRYTCDRCGKAEFISSANVDRAGWRDMTRQSDNGEVVRLYCAECYGSYRQLLLKQDAEFTTFDNAKRGEK